MNKLLFVFLLLVIGCGKKTNQTVASVPEETLKTYACAFKEVAMGTICTGGLTNPCFPAFVKYYTCVESKGQVCWATTSTSDVFEKTNCPDLDKDGFLESISDT